MNIIKRNGEEQVFDPNKVRNAIKKANTSVPESDRLTEEQIETITKAVSDVCEISNRALGVEEIQDAVEFGLMKIGMYKVAKNYITYRYLQSLTRDKYKDLMNRVSEKLCAKKVENQNANVDESSFGGRTGEAANVLTKEYALNFLMSKKAREAHLDNTIYTHDLDSYSIGDHNCLSMPIDYLLSHGFNTRQTDVRPAQSVNTAFQLVAVLFQLQSLNQFGGVSATHLDSSMVPYVRKSFFKHYLMNYLKNTPAFEALGLLDMSSDELDDWVDKNKQKYLDEFHLSFDDFRFDNEDGVGIDKNLFKKAMFDTIVETKQAVEGMLHNLNTLQSRSGSQLPFSSANLGLDTSKEGRLVTKCVLEAIYNGIGKLHKTSIFPCLIFQKKKGVNDKGSPNYDLYKLALKATASRDYPNYCDCDWDVQVDAIKKDRELKNRVIEELGQEKRNILKDRIKENPRIGNLLGLRISPTNSLEVIKEVSPLEENGTMGCVDGSSVIDYKIGSDRYVEPIEKAWNRLSLIYDIKKQQDGKNDYIDTDDVSIYDCLQNRYVAQYRMIRNASKNWMSITFSNGRYIDVTVDHPFEVINKGVVQAEDLLIGDTVYRDVCSKECQKQEYCFDSEAWLYGLSLCDSSYVQAVLISLGMDELDLVNSAKDALAKIGYDVTIREQHRGDKGDYIDVYVKNSKPLCRVLHDLFGGSVKKDRQVPNCVFSNYSYSQKLSFMAGMIDADGYINNSGNSVKVQLGSTNPVLALGQMLLAKEIGLNASIYKNHYSSTDYSKIRYRVEFNATEEILMYLRSQKKVQHGDSAHCFNMNAPINSNVCSVQSIKEYSCDKFSYDVSTESEHFSVNGIYSHNCRTWNGFDVNFEETYRKNIDIVLNGGDLPEYVQTSGIQKDGRGNVCPVTIILPTLAMMAKERAQKEGKPVVDCFMEILSNKITDARDILIERFDWICSQSPKSAKFIYENNTLVGYVPEEGIRSAMKHGTLVIGQLGLAECLRILIGVDHTSFIGMKLAKRIEQFYKDMCARFKNETHLNFGVYYTPAENLCYTAMKKFKEKYGIIKDVSDREFFTNSMHVPVWVPMSPFDKIDIESELTNYSSAGCITYVELDASCKNNLDALETIVDYAMESHRIPYFAVNVPIDTCTSCGYTDELDKKCPMCGCEDIVRLRRVTGYLSQDYRHFNYGKQKEVEARVKHG